MFMYQKTQNGLGGQHLSAVIQVSAGTSITQCLEERGPGAKPFPELWPGLWVLTNSDTELVPCPCTHSQASGAPPELVTSDDRAPGQKAQLPMPTSQEGRPRQGPSPLGRSEPRVQPGST